MANVRAVPEGMHTVTPHLVVKNGAEAIDFYKKAFGAIEESRALTPDGRVMHAEIKVGDSIVFLSDEFLELRPPTATRFLNGVKRTGAKPVTSVPARLC
jgi:uncharacterized glyoxalase superfamily protein PhnB